MMIENKFDSKIKDLIDSYEPVEVAPSVWEGIEKSLARRRKIVLYKRIVSSVAVAAVLLLGIFILPQNELAESSVYVAEIANVRTEVVTQSPLKDFQTINVIEIRSKCNEVVVEDVVAEDVVVEDVVAEDVVVEDIASEDVQQVVEQEYAIFAVDQDAYEQTVDEITHRRPYQLSVSTNALLSSGGENGEVGPRYAPGMDSSPTTTDSRVLDVKHSLPITFGLNLRVPVSDKLSIGTGLNFSILDSDYKVVVNANEGTIHQQLYYIGVPLYLNYEIIEREHLSFYSFLGGALEKGLKENNLFESVGGDMSNINNGIDGVQWSTVLGMGLEYRFTRLVGIYIDPSLVYYFEGDQPVSIRMTQPLQIKFEVGLRFNL